ncbi:MAG: peptidoglycan editing factor PgeF [Deltaproteobacteria bacterium]|nr:peptidoglycan editing factor PgeF [Deltaproteobacteria bacterium]
MAEPLVLKSELLTARGVRHGFSTRIGGVSEGPFATLNVAVGPGDRAEAVEENLRRFTAAIGVERGGLYQTSQVHGADVRVVEPSDDPAAVLHERADALAAFPSSRGPSSRGASSGGPSTAAHLAVGVRTADCVPILVHDQVTGGVAAIHAGWRGVVSGVVSAAVAQLAIRARGSKGLVAAIGPCIGPCCFEIGDEVVGALLGSVPDESIILRDRERPHADLRRAVRLQLGALGVSEVEDVPGCTRCDAERFYSHRRDGARSGRLLAAIAVS